MCVLQQYVFKRHKVQAVLKQALRDRMEGQQYDPVKAAQVHALGVYHRYSDSKDSFVCFDLRLTSWSTGA